MSGMGSVAGKFDCLESSLIFLFGVGVGVFWEIDRDLGV